MNTIHEMKIKIERGNQPKKRWVSLLFGRPSLAYRSFSQTRDSISHVRSHPVNVSESRGDLITRNLLDAGGIVLCV